MLFFAFSPRYSFKLFSPELEKLIPIIKVFGLVLENIQILMYNSKDIIKFRGDYNALKDYKYRVEYYYGDKLDETRTMTSSAGHSVGTKIEEYRDRPEKDGITYELVYKENYPLTITANEDNNVMKLYYEKPSERTRYPYRIEYYYDGVIDGALTKTGLADLKTTINDYQSQNKEGYTLEKAEGMPLTITEGDNVARIYYKKRTDCEYRIEYYYGDDENGYTIDTGKTVTGTAKFKDKISSFEQKPKIGYEFEYSTPDSITIGINSEDNVIKVYYKKAKFDYKVQHYYENENGEQVISACGMLKSDSDDLRVISAELALDKVSVYVNSFVKMKHAESFLVNTKDDTILASRDTNLISKTLQEQKDNFMQEVGRRISQNQLELSEIDQNMTVFEKIKGTEWILVSYVPAEIIYHDLDVVRTIMTIFGIVSVLVFMLLLERMVHMVIHPVKKLTEVIKIMTNGDFTVSSNTKSHDEIGVMGRCIEKFIAAISVMIAAIDGVSDVLRRQADNSKEVSAQMLSASKEQNDSVKELNTTVEQLSLSVEGIAQSAARLAVFVEGTKKDSDSVNSKMQETVDASEKGKEAIQDMDAAMQNINNSVKKLQFTIDKVGKASEEITNITRVIGDIADKTSLLSLNAYIEAARAGSSGRGFAVVAQEIGTLAQTSMDAVHHIEGFVLEIETSVSDVVNQANESSVNINNSGVLIKNAIDTFDIIFENIAVAGNLVQNMIQKVDQVEDVARNVAEISKEQAASAKKILDSSDNLVEQADKLMENSKEVAEGSERLIVSAEGLAVQIGNFKIKEE